MMKFNEIRKTVKVNENPVGLGSYVYDSNGSYIIKNIDWKRKEIEVDEIEFDDNDNVVIIDNYRRTFSDMKYCD